jgi:hypothetical protein
MTHHRYKIQKQVELLARDRSNKPFLLGVIWRTVAEADRKAQANAVKARKEAAHPKRTFRVAEQWPSGTLPRPI